MSQMKQGVKLLTSLLLLMSWYSVTARSPGFITRWAQDPAYHPTRVRRIAEGPYPGPTLSRLPTLLWVSATDL